MTAATIKRKEHSNIITRTKWFEKIADDIFKNADANGNGLLE